MYYLSITGKRHRRLCKAAVRWFMSKYLARHSIELSVVHRGLLCEGVYGWCTVEDCDYRPRSFLVEVHNQLDVENYLSTLFHELWHVYQFVKGDLRDKRSKRYWKGSLIDDCDYEDDPSEIEAHSMEIILTQEYLLDNPTKTR
jgi:hypothetical protein